MTNKKIFSVLRTLSKKEFSDFEKYLKLQLANQRYAVDTFNYLKRFYPNFADGKRLEISYTYQKIFGEPIGTDPKNRKKLLNLLVDINSCLKDFLILKKMRTPSLESRLIWLYILIERGLANDFRRSIDSFIQKINHLPRKGIFEHGAGFICNYFYYYKVIQRKLEPKINVLNFAARDLENSYAFFRYKTASELANRTKVLRTPLPNLSIFPKDQSLLHPSQKSALLNLLYYHSYQVVLNDSAVDYDLAVETLLKKGHAIDMENFHIILSYLQNFASRQIRKGQEEYWEKAHRLNEFGERNGLFSQKGLTSQTQFNNIINAACKANAFGWASYFKDNYQQFLGDDIRTQTVMLADAIIYYEKKEFELLIPLLQRIQLVDVNHAIRVKSLTIISYIEEGWEEEDVLGACTNFWRFLNRSRKLQEGIIIAVRNFIRLARVLVQENLPNEDLIRKINDTEPLYFKAWFLEKAGQG